MSEDALTVADPQVPKQLQSQVTRAIAELGPATGIAPAISLERLAAKLRSYGLCAIAGIEAVFVKRADGLVEEYHAVYFGDGSWTDSGNGKFMGIHTDGTPAPPPVATYGCPAPVPERDWTADSLPPGWDPALVGKPRFVIQAKRHVGDTSDSTPTLQRACDYCAAIGLGEMGGAPRCGCPVRVDGHRDRVACEDVLLLPPAGVHGPKWVRAGSNVALASCDGAPDSDPCVTANPFQALFRGARLQACSWDATFKDGVLTSGVCSEVIQ